MKTFPERMKGAAQLDPVTYEEVEHDAGATAQALGVVVLASLAAGIGAAGVGGFGGLLLGTIGQIVGWVVWAGLIYLIGAKLLPEEQTQANWGQLLRTTGFAMTPGVIRILGIIPFLRGLVFLVAAIWMLVAMVIAIRQALDYRSTWRAVGVCVIGWLVQALVLALFIPFR